MCRIAALWKERGKYNEKKIVSGRKVRRNVKNPGGGVCFEKRVEVVKKRTRHL